MSRAHMPGIFISYRREDAGGHAGRLCDRLNDRLGPDSVFMDVEDVRPGQDFVRAIEDTVAACDYLLVVIGPRWLEAMNRRATAEHDFVRHEITAGLRGSVTVVPVLVAGASMPGPRELPPELAELSRRNAIHVRDDAFEDDVSRLVEFLGGRSPRLDRRRSAHPFSRRWLAGAVVLTAVAIAGSLYFSSPVTPPVDGDWIAEMQKPRQQPYRIRLTFRQAGSTLTGVVRYPTGDAVIQDGTIDGEAIVFSTSHIPQFESERAIIRYTGTIEPDGIRLSSTDDAGLASGVARRAPP